ncbi:MAG: hypothetical protein ACYC1H_02685 [Rectinema subterraneum]
MTYKLHKRFTAALYSSPRGGNRNPTQRCKLINPGNSGGHFLVMQDRAICINSQIIAKESMPA